MSSHENGPTRPDDSTRPLARPASPDRAASDPSDRHPSDQHPSDPSDQATSVQPAYRPTDESDRPVGAPAPAPVRPSERPVTDPHGPGTTFFTNHPDDVVAREKDAYGGLQIGSAFFGWLVAVGLTALLLGLLSVVGVALGVAGAVPGDADVASLQDLPTAGVVALVLVGVGLFLAYLGGGYVAGRMARFDGLKQGLGVWLWAVLVSVLLGVVGYLAGDRFDVLAQLDTLGLPVGATELTVTAAVVAGVVLVVALVGALLGGAAGTHYHRKVDRVGLLSEPEEARTR